VILDVREVFTKQQKTTLPRRICGGLISGYTAKIAGYQGMKGI